MNKSFILLKWQTRVCVQFPTGKDREHLFVPVIQYVLLRKGFQFFFWSSSRFVKYLTVLNYEITFIAHFLQKVFFYGLL